MALDLSSLARGALLVKNYVKTLAATPGVYRMLNQRDQVLYVGKAKNLRKRVITYAQPDRLPLRLQRMVAETVRMEFVSTHTEAEALLLEANLIKKFSPPYNVLMRDSKSFAFIRLTDHPYPLLTKHRGARTAPGDYYGPFASTVAVNTTLTTLHRAFLLRSCPDTVFSSRKRPCLQYQIKRCSAPCVGYISEEDYARLVSQTREFFKGKTTQIQKSLAEKMEEASEAQDYEQAALFRDRIQALTAIQSRQLINIEAVKDADVFAIYAEKGHTCIQLFLFRKGSNYGTHAAFPSHGEDVPLEAVLEAYITQFYEDAIPPPEIFLNQGVPDRKVLEAALSQKAQHKVSLHIPRSGPKAELVFHVLENAKRSLERYRLEKASTDNLLQAFAEAFDLPNPPQRIEVYDNSHTQGTYGVGAMIVAGPSGFIKSAYRKFNIREAQNVRGGDDYGMLREVLTRRFSKALSHDQDDTSQWPDVVLIDGGKGQLSVAQAVFADLGISDVTIIAIAKGPDRNAGKETFYRSDFPPLQLPSGDKVLYFLERLRDEAHRFAIGTHRTRRLKAISLSKLDDIPGIGATRKRALLRHFGSTKAVEGAGLKDLESVEGISRTVAKKIYDYFHEHG